MSDLRIFQSDDSLLIRGLGDADIELTRDEARHLVDALSAVIAPPVTTRRYRKPLSAQERSEFKRLYEAGRTDRQIAAHFGLSKNSVPALRLRYGIPARDQARAKTQSAAATAQWRAVKSAGKAA